MVALGGLGLVAVGGHAWLLWGGVCGCSQGVACMVAPGGHAWLLRGACVVFSMRYGQ